MTISSNGATAYFCGPKSHFRLRQQKAFARPEQLKQEMTDSLQRTTGLDNSFTDNIQFVEKGSARMRNKRSGKNAGIGLGGFLSMVGAGPAAAKLIPVGSAAIAATTISSGGGLFALKTALSRFGRKKPGMKQAREQVLKFDDDTKMGGYIQEHQGHNQANRYVQKRTSETRAELKQHLNQVRDSTESEQVQKPTYNTPENHVYKIPIGTGIPVDGKLNPNRPATDKVSQSYTNSLLTRRPSVAEFLLQLSDHYADPGLYYHPGQINKWRAERDKNNGIIPDNKISRHLNTKPEAES